MRHLFIYENFENEVEPYKAPLQIQCNKCGWNWNSTQTSEKDLYVCHKCGADNKEFYRGESEGD